MSRRRQERMAVELKKVLSCIFTGRNQRSRLDFSCFGQSRELSNDLSHIVFL